MTAALLEEVVVRLYRSILGRGAGEKELADRVRRAEIADNEVGVLLDMVDELLASEEFALRYGHNKSFQKVTDSDVFYAFKFLLGRFPENESIYLGKRKKPSTTSLIDEIVASDEFKTNKILKDLVSIRRKPKGFDELARSGNARNKKKVLVISGCQGRMISDLLQSGGGFEFVENIFLSNDQFNKFITSKGQSHANLLDWADVIYTQKPRIYEVLQESQILCKKSKLMPLAEYVGLHPDQCYLTDLRSGKAVVGPMGEYQSTILAAAFFAGLDAQSAVEAFHSEVYEEFGFREISETSRSSFLSQEENTGYPLKEMLSRWESNGKWMRTINHPKKMVLTDLVSFSLKQEGITPIAGFDEFVIDDLAANVDWPAYGGDKGNSPTTELAQLDFKLPKAFSPKANSAAFLTLREFAEMFYRSMEGYTIDMILCHQLGRKIDLEKLSKYLRDKFTNG